MCQDARGCTHNSLKMTGLLFNMNEMNVATDAKIEEIFQFRIFIVCVALCIRYMHSFLPSHVTQLDTVQQVERAIRKENIGGV